MLNIWTFLLILLNWNRNKFPNISVNIEGEEKVDHILEIPRVVVFGVKCFLVYKIIFTK